MFAKFFKSFSCFVLSAIICFSSLVFTETVFAAADFKLAHSFAGFLIKSSSGVVPLPASSGFPNNTVSLTWQMKNDDANVDNGIFLLRYPVADGIYAQVYLKKTGLDYQLKYTLADATAAMIDSVRYPSRTPLAGESYTVNYGSAGYGTIAGFVNSPNGDYSASTDADGIPEFKMKAGTGFSIKFREIETHFSIGTDGTFKYTTSGFEDGIIYDFDLFLGSVSEAFSPSITQKVSICNALSGFKSVTKASGVKTAGDEINIQGGEILAESENRLNLSFNIPKVWNGTKFVNDIALGKSKYEATQNMEVRIPLVVSNDLRFEVVVDGLFSPKAPGTGSATKVEGSNPAVNFRVPGSSNATIGAPSIIQNNTADPLNSSIVKRMEIEIGDLDYGLLFKDVSLRCDTTNVAGLYFKPKTIGDGIVYTFIKYNIVPIRDRYYAAIEPYKDAKGIYTLIVNGSEAVEVNASGTEELIYIPMPLTPLSGTSGKFQIKFSLFSKTGIDVLSQRSNFTAKKEDFAIGTADDFTVIRYDMKTRDLNPNVCDLTVDIGFEIGKVERFADLIKNVGDKIRIRYDLNSQLNPNAPGVDADTIETFDIIITRTGTDNKFSIEYVPVSGGHIYLDTTNTSAEFANIRNFTNTVYDYDTVNKAFRAYVRLKFEAVAASPVGSTAGLPLDPFFEYPNVYFLCTKPTEKQFFDKATETWQVTDNDLGISSSLFDSMTLSSETTKDVPPPQNLNISENKNDGVASFKVNWSVPTASLNEFINSFSGYDSFKYGFDIYLTNDLTKLNTLNAELSKLKTETERDAFFAANTANYVVFPQNFLGANGDIADVTAQVVAAVTIREMLRQGKVVIFTDVPINEDNDLAQQLVDKKTTGVDAVLNRIFSGLEKNQKHYVSMSGSVTCLVSGAPIIKKFSKMSSIVAETTVGDVEIPDSADKPPKAPVIKDFAAGDITLTSALLRWNEIIETSSDPADIIDIGYEVLRLRDKAMNSSELDKRLPLSEVYASITPHTDGTGKFGMDISADGFFQYTSSGLAPLPDTIDVVLDEEVSINDKSLQPNNLYFYYARTYKTVNGSAKIYSVWTLVSVTTKPVDCPVNLIFSRNYTDIDKYKQARIEFDAPIPTPVLNATDNRITGFRFEYSIRQDNGDWGSAVAMNATALYNSRSTSKLKDHTHFGYTISGLEPGKTYFIRVRMVDELGVPSVYSNTAEIRTELDQEEFDNEVNTDSWLDYVVKELETLVKDSVFKSTTGNYGIYRTETFSGLVNTSKDGSFRLYSSGKDYQEYYIPSEGIKNLKSAGKSIVISSNGFEIVIPPSVFSSDTNAYKLIDTRIKNKSAEDYYLKITVGFSSRTASINGYDPISKLAQIDLALSASLISSEEIDEEIINAILAKVAEITSDSNTRAELKALVAKGTNNVELVKYVDKIVATVIASFSKTLDGIKTKNISYVQPISPYAANISVKFTTDSKNSIAAFKSAAGSFVDLSITGTGTARTFATSLNGSYVFGAKNNAVIGFAGKPNADVLNNLVNKYNLSDFINVETAADLALNASYYDAANIVARIAGAKSTDDAYTFLKNKGYTIPARYSGAISKQETLYLLGILYELKTGTKIDSVKILNYGLTSKITGIDQKYLKSVQVMYQLGVHREQTMNPKTSATAENLLTMLGNLGKKINL